MKNIYEIAKKAGIAEKFVIPFGNDNHLWSKGSF